MTRWWVALFLAVPSVASAQNLAALDVEAPEVLVAGLPADFDVTFIGDGTTPSFQAELLLVREGRESTGVLLAPIGPLTAPAGVRQERTIRRTVPSNLEGAYQIALRIDPTNAVAETNEFDNFVFSETYLLVRPRAPDAVAVSVVPAAATVMNGAMLDVDVTVRNDGELAGAIVASVRLSRDDRIDTADLEIGRQTINLGIGVEATRTIATTIPSAARARGYRVGVVLDPDGAIVEGAEDDNTAIAASSVGVFWSTLLLDTATAPVATLLTRYELRFAASGGDGTYSYAVTGGALPDGLMLSPSGVLSGSPTRTGSFDFDVEVSSDGLMASRSYTIEVNATGAPVTIVPVEIVPAFKNLDYEQRLVVGGGEGPYDWTLIDGELPAGITLGSDGVLSGAPTEIGTYAFEVQVEDFRGATDEAAFELEVIFASQVLVLTRAPEIAPFGDSVQLQLQAIGGVPPYEWTALTVAPPGLTLSAAGVLSGTPTEVGTFKMRVRASDSTNDPSTDSALVTIIVEDVGGFEIATPPLETATVRALYQVVFEADGGTPPLTWRLAPGSQLPDGFFLEAGDGTDAPVGTLRLYGVGFREVDQPFILRVDDAAGRRREAVYVLSVRAGTASGTSEGCVCVEPRRESLSWVFVLGLVALGLARRR